MRGLKQRDGAEFIDRARQLHFDVARQVAQIEKLEFAVGEQEAHAALVLGGVALGSPGVLAQRIRAAVIDGLGDGLRVRGHHDGVQARDRQFVAGMHGGALAGGQCLIRIPGRSAAGILRFDGISVVEIMLDGDHPGERRCAAHMIAVKVRDQQVIDLLDPGLLRGLVDALGVAIAGRGVAGVHQQALPRGRDDQRGGAAFDVDPIDVQIPGLRVQRGAAQCAGQ